MMGHPLYSINPKTNLLLSVGNTISDMMGIGSAWYVESMAGRLGAHPPDLSPAQLDLASSRLVLFSLL